MNLTSETPCSRPRATTWVMYIQPSIDSIRQPHPYDRTVPPWLVVVLASNTHSYTHPRTLATNRSQTRTSLVSFRGVRATNVVGSRVNQLVRRADAGGCQPGSRCRVMRSRRSVRRLRGTATTPWVAWVADPAGFAPVDVDAAAMGSSIAVRAFETGLSRFNDGPGLSFGRCTLLHQLRVSSPGRGTFSSATHVSVCRAFNVGR